MATRLSGSTRRRNQAERRTAQAIDLDIRWALILDRIPRSAVAVSMCPCGRRAFLCEGASQEDWDAFLQDDDAHDQFCEVA